jgi:peptidoglycan/LPS O-acetylase OafA/YrhL
MYRSGLVPRRMAWLGLIGGPLLLIGNVGVLFDSWEPTSVAFLVAPEFVWELFLGIYAAVWGFRKDAPILSPSRAAAPQLDAT